MRALTPAERGDLDQLAAVEAVGIEARLARLEPLVERIERIIAERA